MGSPEVTKTPEQLSNENAAREYRKMIQHVIEQVDMIGVALQEQEERRIRENKQVTWNDVSRLNNMRGDLNQMIEFYKLERGK